MSQDIVDSSAGFEEYFKYLKTISPRARLYKRYFTSRILFWCARRFGPRIIEVGSGIGSGVLGAYPKNVFGIDINPFAVEYSKNIGLLASVLKPDGSFPAEDASFNACILDNVLEHIENPRSVLDECSRVSKHDGGLIIAVPGIRGFRWDSDHKVFYSEEALRSLDHRWRLQSLFSVPGFIKSEGLSRRVRQYCLVSIYKKHPGRQH
jgi:SAM-dependent methyltransferase